jgi:hypothetical protein
VSVRAQMPLPQPDDQSGADPGAAQPPEGARRGRADEAAEAGVVHVGEVAAVDRSVRHGRRSCDVPVAEPVRAWAIAASRDEAEDLALGG